jgi:nitrogen fixation/metabolism regulation signal transduction histidine kinase
VNRSIRTKIQGSLIGSILVVGICAAIVIIVNQVIASKNEMFIETMTKEYSIITTTDELILAYNDAVKSPGNVDTMVAYQAKRDKLLDIVASLYTRIESENSLATLVGVENTVKKVVAECDAGIEEIQQNNFLNISDHFKNANVNNEYVKDNTRNLLQNELEHLSAIQVSSRQIYTFSLFTSIGMFVLTIVVVLFFASSFSRQLVLPIEMLSVTAKRVAAGEMDFPIEKKLLDQKDEVGVLASSFVSMVNTIKTKISELSESKEALEKGNQELEKLNSFMVDREIKMVELKKQVSELEKKA